MDETLSKTGYRLLCVAVKISFVIAVIAFGLYLVLAILCSILPRAVVDGWAFMPLTGPGFRVLEEQWMGSVLLWVRLPMITMGLIFIWLLRRLVYSLQEGSPFTHANVCRIRWMGWSLLAGVYLEQFCNYCYVMRLNLDNLQAYFTLLPNGALVALCVLALAEVFRYGCILQHEHDTTV